MVPTTSTDADWPVRDRFLELHSRWMTLIGERLQDPQGQILEYWRIQKADSVIVLPIQGDRIFLPAPIYRPGVGQTTLDFPGGRVAEGITPEQAAMTTLQRELAIEAVQVEQLIRLNPQGWAVNSSFSDQRLHGFVAYLDATSALSFASDVRIYSTDSRGLEHLLQDLLCLQCRAVLLEWWHRVRG